MNEPEILEAYRDLSRPTSPPDGLLDRVDGRIRRRRTVRRGLAGVAALAVAGGVGVVALGGDDGRAGQVAGDPGGGTDTSTLTYTDTDGSTHTFEAQDIGIACTQRATEGGRTFDVLALTLNAMVPAAGRDEAPPDEAFSGPVLHVEVITDEVRPGQVFDLPFDMDSGSDRRPMTFFFTNGVDDDSNELSSAEPGSAGTVTVHEATCGPSPSLWVEVDGTLGSEEQQAPLAIEGEYRS